MSRHNLPVKYLATAQCNHHHHHHHHHHHPHQRQQQQRLTGLT